MVGWKAGSCSLATFFFEHFHSTSLALTEDGLIIGFLIGFRSQSHPHIAYIHFVGVDPVHRGKGLGRTLYLHFFEQMKSMECTEVQCITSPINKTSIAFHSAMGFDFMAGDDVVDNIPVYRNHAGAGQPRVVFRRLLN
ncbi:MAG: GNAT family N-acetyltransferase [Steroidobacter sp.]